MFRYSVSRPMESDSRTEDEKESKQLDSTTQRHQKYEKKVAARSNDRNLLDARGYTLLNQRLGEGSYSKVKRAFCRYTNTDVAVKIVNRDIAPPDFLERFLPRELEVIGHLNHPNICKFIEVFDVGRKVYVIMEHAKKGDLLDHIQKHKYIEENMAREIFSQIVSAVQYLHRHNILHRDLKCENILLTANNKPLVTDFGFAKHQTNMMDLSKTFCGSSAYAPLEILKGIPYDGRSAEVWSLGVILFVMTTGTMPFNDSDKTQQMKQMRKGISFLCSRQKLSEPLRCLIRMMLNLNFKSRITMDGIEQSDWINGRESMCAVDKNDATNIATSDL